MTANAERRTTEIQSWDEVPAFANEDEEDAYWQTHSLGEPLLTQMADGPGDPRLPLPRRRDRTEAISVRIDVELLGRLKAIARQRGIGYQTLLKQWLGERLAAEARRPAQPTGSEAAPGVR